MLVFEYPNANTYDSYFILQFISMTSYRIWKYYLGFLIPYYIFDLLKNHRATKITPKVKYLQKLSLPPLVYI